MKITNKYIIEVFGFPVRHWWNGSKPFVDDINKAFICPSLKSAEKNKRTIDEGYGYKNHIIPLKIET